jgi:hypothetical protein
MKPGAEKRVFWWRCMLERSKGAVFDGVGTARHCNRLTHHRCRGRPPLWVGRLVAEILRAPASKTDHGKMAEVLHPSINNRSDHKFTCI